MCDCNEKKSCCDCLKGGCECLCDCTCHTDGSVQYPRLSCPECIAAEEAWDKKMDEEDAKEAEEIRQYNANLPSEAEIQRILG